MKDVLLSVKNLRTSYEVDNTVYKAVNGISFDVHTKECLGIVGEAGAGKTTTALSIMGLLPKDLGRVEAGEVTFKGDDLLDKSQDYVRMLRGSLISMVFQDPMTSLNPVMTIEKQISEVLEFHNKIEVNNKFITKYNKKDISEKVDEILKLVGIPPERKYEYPHQFSGGMKQRVIIAMALVGEPELLIADEPTSALDVTIQAQILNIIADLKDILGTSMIIITHDLGVVAETCDNVAIMYAGEIIEYGTVKDIFTGDKHHPYTEGLMQSIPDLETETRRLITIDGMMPDSSQLPVGCKFKDRCKWATGVCEMPVETLYSNGTHRIKCHKFLEEESCHQF